ncbi:hypothetical protein ABZS84_36105 [Streptomyces sp. NPDC005481]|uniref:hypothetical protein n=1 Tax=Streptomyces sp. NPDC005481 TaxID=3154881 RepID=UPI0033B687A1
MSDSVSRAEGPQETAAPWSGFPAERGHGLPAPASVVSPGQEHGTQTGPAEPGHDPSAPAPLDVPRTPTGHPAVDALLDRLADADHLATDGHVEVYEDVHRSLRDELTALDARQGPPVPSPPTAPPSSYDHRS